MFTGISRIFEMFSAGRMKLLDIFNRVCGIFWISSARYLGYVEYHQQLLWHILVVNEWDVWHISNTSSRLFEVSSTGCMGYSKCLQQSARNTLHTHMGIPVGYLKYLHKTVWDIWNIFSTTAGIHNIFSYGSRMFEVFSTGCLGCLKSSTGYPSDISEI